MNGLPLEEADVAVVGGGPAGLIAALALADTGASVALIAPIAAAKDGRTTAFLAGSIEELEAMGLWPELAPHAALMRRMRLVDGTRRLIRTPEITFHASEIGLEAFGANIANSALIAALTRAVAARGGQIRLIESNAEAIIPHEAAGAMTITAANGCQIRCRLVVGADGRASTVRTAAGISARGWRYPQTALVMNLNHTEPHDDTSTEFHTETGPFTLVPLAERRSSLVCVVRPAEAARLAALADAELGHELEVRAHSILGRFTCASERQTWPLSSLKAETLGRGRTVLVGEAAHALPPIGAQGLNLGIRDIAALAALLRRARRAGADIGGASVVERYARGRQADVISRTFGVDILNRSLLSSFPPVQIARMAMTQIVRDVGPIRRLLMREGLRPQFL